jgi:TRAP-type C4-dicarboxylate transport system permease large subunit
MIKPLIPLLIGMIFTLLAVTFIPELSLFLPRLFGF